MQRLLIPLFLLLAAIASFVISDNRGEKEPTSVATTTVVSPATPLLSARRAPEYLNLPQAREQVAVELADIANRSPQLSCLVAHDVDGVELFASNGEVGLAPASVQKLVTASAALIQLGPEARYRTVVAASATPTDGVLEGDLHLIGGGDPLLHTDAYAASFPYPLPFTRLEQLADDVVAAGVLEIRGGIVADESRYDVEREPALWSEGEDLAQTGFTGPLSALMVNDGFSSFPEIREPGVFPTPADDPSTTAATIFDDLLEARGVIILGGARTEPEPVPGLIEIAAIESAPMSEQVAVLLTHSDNTSAELILKELGLSMSGEGGTDAGGLAVLEILGAAGVDVSALRVVDGSGLSDRNRVSCDLIMDLLELAGRESILAEGLAVAGQSGTMRERFANFPLGGNVRAKTGSLVAVAALAGFVDTTKGTSVSFAYIANLEPEITEELIALQEPMLTRMADYPSGPPIEELEPFPIGAEPAPPYVSANAPARTEEPAATPTAPPEDPGLGPDE